MRNDFEGCEGEALPGKTITPQQFILLILNGCLVGLFQKKKKEKRKLVIILHDATKNNSTRVTA